MSRKVAGVAALLAALTAWAAHPAFADNENSAHNMLKRMKAGGSTASSGGTTSRNNWSSHAGSGGKAVTATEIVSGGSVAPFLVSDSATALQAAETRYQAIVSAGGWNSVRGGKFKKGGKGTAVAALNKRLFAEGYLRAEATQGEFADIYTSATEDAVTRFQRNHGLAATGMVDSATLKELNIPAAKRLSTIRANLPRVAEYSKDLGPRYVVVNVPAMQIEAIANGSVYSVHNAIVGRPLRPTPVVMTNLATVKFNPYWNAPASIVERDLLPRMRTGGASRVLNQMNIKVFDGVGGPEVNPDRINWRRVQVDDYHFRQEPGGGNAMKTAKIEFNSPFGIYMHDTPEPELFDYGQRFYSSGCVRVEKVAILINWILNGQDGIDNARIAELADTKERLDVAIASAPQLRVAYLTAWPARNGEVAFRPDIYELDGTGFVVGQPLPVGEKSGGQRYVLKPVPRSQSAVDADEASNFFGIFGRSRNPDKDPGAVAARSDSDTPAKNVLKLKPKTKSGAKGKTVVATGNWNTEEVNGVKRPPFKTVSKKKKTVVAKSGSKTPSKKIAKKTTVTTAAKKPADAKTKTATAAAKKPGTAKPVAAGSCKPGAGGKLPAGCKVPATTAKPAPATTAKPTPVATATPTTAAN